MSEQRDDGGLVGGCSCPSPCLIHDLSYSPVFEKEEPMSDKSREQFEAWAKRQLPFSVDLRTIPGSGYVNSTIHVLWELWKARDAEINNLKKFEHIIHEADGELSAIAHGRPPSDKDELLRLSNELRKLAKILGNI